MEGQTARLYVGNLPYVAQKQDVENLFQSNNVEIKKIDMSIDPFTGRNPSYCFVDFHDEETAQHVLSTMQGQHVRGRPVKINLKTERGQTTGNRLPTKTYDRGWRPQESSVSNADPDTAYAFDRWNRDDASSHWVAPLEERRRIWVGGLPRIPNQDTLNVEMRNLFAAFNVEAVSKLISPHHTQWSQEGSHYSCFVDLATDIDAKNAITMVNQADTPHGGKYKVSLAKHTLTKIVEREQLGITSRLFVGGLPYFPSQDALEAEIRQIFDGREVKHITNLKTPHESKQKEGEDYHYCFVELANPQDAQAAVEALDGKQLPSGAVYKIRLARESLPQNGAQGTPRQNQRTAPATGRNLAGSWRRAD